MFDHPHAKIFFLISSLSLPCNAALCRYPAISSQGAETGTSLSASSPQEAAESKEATSEPFLQTMQPKCPQTLLAGQAFQSFYQHLGADKKY